MIPNKGHTSRVAVVLAVVGLAAACGPGTDGPHPGAPGGIAASAGSPLTEIVYSTDWHDLKLIESLRAFIPTVMDAQGTPGLNLALARHGQVIWEAGFGYADQGSGQLMTPETVFRSGSMGKTYTGTAVMQLVEDGVLELDGPINRYLPFEVHNPLGDREITVRDLLTHRSGLYGNAAGSDFEAPLPLGEHLAAEYREEYFPPYNRTAFQRWAHKVGETFQYSNFGLATLGYLVEVTNPEGLSFSDYVQQHIMEPLGMSSSRYPPVQDAPYVPEDILDRVSTGYARYGAVDIPTPRIHFADFPAGNVLSTPGDHIRLLLAYLNEGTLDGFELLEPESVRAMLTPQLEAFPGLDLGLIWLLSDHGTPTFKFSHGGAHMFGWNHDFMAYPQQDFALVAATNHWGQPIVDREATFIGEYVSTWLRYNPDDGESRSALPDDWAWKTSYVMGLHFIEQMGWIGAEAPITDEMIDDMATGAVWHDGRANSEAGWDPEGFRAGAHDMRGVDMNLEAIADFLASEACRVTPEDLELIGRQLRNFGVPLFGGRAL